MWLPVATLSRMVKAGCRIGNPDVIVGQIGWYAGDIWVNCGVDSDWCMGATYIHQF